MPNVIIASDATLNIKKENLQEGLDIKVVGSEDDLKQHLLVHGNELLIPLRNISCALARLILVVISSGKRLSTVVLAVLQNLFDTLSITVQHVSQ